MTEDHRPRGTHYDWFAEETEAREQTVWIGRLVANILAAGWNATWMAIASAALAALATLWFTRTLPVHPARTEAVVAVRVEPAQGVASADAALAAMRVRVAESEARERAEERRRLEEARETTVRALAEAEARELLEREQATDERRRRQLAEQERDLARLDASQQAHQAMAERPAPPRHIDFTAPDLRRQMVEHLVRQLRLPTPEIQRMLIETAMSARPVVTAATMEEEDAE